MRTLPAHLSRMSADEREAHQVGTLKIVVADTLGMLLDELGLPRKELARRLGKSDAWVSRALSGTQNLTLASVAKIAHALGARVDFRLRPAHRTGTPAENDAPLPGWVRDGDEVKHIAVHFGTSRSDDEWTTEGQSDIETTSHWQVATR